MFTEEYEGINTFLKGASSLLLKFGVKRQTRGFTCYELPEPFIFKITNPRARIVTIPERKWNPVLPYAESLWLARGRNDVKLIGGYLDEMKKFSDDGTFLRGGYGPRLRKINGISNDYKIGYKSIQSETNKTEVDQFEYIQKVFAKDANTRQAIISIGDPSKDCFEKDGKLKNTKDFPCTRELHFQKQSNCNKLNLTVYMRSNDFIWGASAVNIFNFTFMQEYFAQILGLEIGDYYHIANNFHFYEKHKEKLEFISGNHNVIETSYNYKMTFKSLEEFDELLITLSQVEKKLREKKQAFINFNDDFFDDWFKALYCFNLNKRVNFKNPILNVVYKKYMKYG